MMEHILIHSQVDKVKLYRWITILLLAMCILSLVPASFVAAEGVGGYISERVLGITSPDNTKYKVGIDGGSILDIYRGSIGMDENSGAFRLNSLIPLLMMAMLVLVLLKVLASTELSIMTIIIAAIAIYVFYAFFPGIQEAVTRLLGGEGV